MQSRVLLRSAGLAAVLSASTAPAVFAQTTFFPLPSSTGYVDGADAYANQATDGPYATNRATRNFSTNTGTTTRALSVAANTQINAGTFTTPGGYTGTMPALFGGFTAVTSNASEAASVTVRTQFQSHSGGDYINVNVYHESNSNDKIVALDLRLATALVFAADSVTSLAELTNLTYVGGSGVYYAPDTSATHRVVVRDADSGNFYVSSASHYGEGGTISLGGSNWGLLSTSDLTSVGSFSAASFTSFDYIGIYSDSIVSASGIGRYAPINRFSLSSLSYTITPVPEPATAAALLGLCSLAAVALRRRRRAAR